jgi:hypothetical protein
MKVSLSNTFTKGERITEETENRISGNRLSGRNPVVVRKAGPISMKKIRKGAMLHKLDSSRSDLTPDDAADAALIMKRDINDVDAMVRVVSESGDVIYSPGTQSRYSAERAIKSNLQRRIPGSVVRVSDIGGDGLVRLSLSISYEVNEATVDLTAHSLASPSDMTITSATVVCGDDVYDIDPVDQARSPEETAVFLKRLAANCVLR